MTKLLLPLLFYMSGVLNPFGVNEPIITDRGIYDPTIEALIYPELYGPIVFDDNGMCKPPEICKPTGVETIIYSDAKPEAPPVKKETVKAKKQPAVKQAKRNYQKKLSRRKPK